MLTDWLLANRERQRESEDPTAEQKGPRRKEDVVSLIIASIILKPTHSKAEEGMKCMLDCCEASESCSDAGESTTGS